MTRYTTQWKSTRAPQKTKAELREMLAEAVRNTQAENILQQAAAGERDLDRLKYSAFEKLTTAD